MLIKLSLSTGLLFCSFLGASSLSSGLNKSTLVVYNSNIGLVHEERSISLDRGRQGVLYPDVASTVETDSVNVVFPSGVQLYSQKYKYDKVSVQKLLLAYINKEVEVKVPISKEAFEVKKATLLSADDRVLLRLEGGKIIQANAADILFQAIPDTLITQPSLLWDVMSNKKIYGQLELDYLINDISWKSDYVLSINENTADLSAWITLNNNSGKAFKDVDLKVLAGEISREKTVSQRPDYMYQRAKAMQMEAMPAVQEVSHEGYHIYTIPFRVDIADKEKTQIKFIDEKAIKIQRRYDVHLSAPQWLKAEKKHKVNQYIEFKDLSKALPQGIIRTYSSLEGSTVLLGINTIYHTPKKEKVSLKIGKNFDLLVKESTLSKNETKTHYEAEVKYTLTNRSNKAITLELLVPFVQYSALESVIKSDVKYEFKDGNTVKFSIYLKADSVQEFNVKYRNRR